MTKTQDGTRTEELVPEGRGREFLDSRLSCVSAHPFALFVAYRRVRTVQVSRYVYSVSQKSYERKKGRKEKAGKGKGAVLVDAGHCRNERTYLVLSFRELRPDRLHMSRI